MGQYYKVINLDKCEVLVPHLFDDGAKLLEFGCSAYGTMTALAILLVNSNGRGGGDFDPQDGGEYAGRWAGDRIIIAGDYAKRGDKFEHEEENLYDRAKEKPFVDISVDVFNEMHRDASIRH
jgi:hypothetical protein